MSKNNSVGVNKYNAKWNIYNKNNKILYFAYKPSSVAYLSSILGFFGTLWVVPIQHPFDVIRVNWQMNPRLRHEFEVAKVIKRDKGYKGFYYGFGTNWLKQLTKSVYRYPFVTTLPRLYGKLLGLDYDKEIHRLKFLTSLSIAILEAWVITPFERVQVFMMTSKSKSENYKDFFNMSRK